MKRVVGTLIVLGLIGGAVWIGLASGRGETVMASRLIDGVLYEYADEATKARIAAMRALAATELMEPLAAHTYLPSDREGLPRRTAEGWIVRFTPSDCAPKDNVYTCRPLASDNGSGMAVTVTPIDDRWEVVRVEGDIPADHLESLIGSSVPDASEASHWDMTAAAVGGERSDAHRFVEVWPFWVGPYPTDAPGSVCEVTPVDVHGAPVGAVSSFYQERPTRPFDIHGWSRGAETDLPAEAVDAEVVCEQYSGEGWVQASAPRLLGSPGAAYGAEVTMRWQGEQGFTAPMKCHVSLLDNEGEVVWEDDKFVHGVWRPRELDVYPYETVVSAHSPPSLPATKVGRFDCESL